MGQRLNIEIVNNSKTLANCYYHWSAYTDCAIDLAKDIIGECTAAYDENNCVKEAVRLLETTGGGVNDDEKLRISLLPKFKDIDFKEAISRNYGLIAVTDEGIQETRFWQEGCVTINIENRSVDFDVFFHYSSDEFIYDYSKDEYDSLESCDKRFENVPFEMIDQFCEYVHGLPDAVKIEDGSVLVCIR